MDRNWTRALKLVLPLAALLAMAVLAACGGSSSDSEGDASADSGDGGGGNLTLVAYSTPEEAYRELIPAFNKTPEG